MNGQENWAATDTVSVQGRCIHFFTAWSSADGYARACNWLKADDVKLTLPQPQGAAH